MKAETGETLSRDRSGFVLLAEEPYPDAYFDFPVTAD